MEKLPIFIINGFLEAGKTQFMKFTMPDNFEFITTDPTGRYVLYYVFGSVAFGMLIIWGLMRKST